MRDYETFSVESQERESTSWTRFHAAVFGGDPTMPPKAWEINVAGFLFERGYCAASTAEALIHGSDFGSVECCRPLSFDDRDRAAVESMLPEALMSEWLRADDGRSIKLAVDLGELPIDPAGWARWQREHASAAANLALLL